MTHDTNDAPTNPPSSVGSRNRLPDDAGRRFRQGCAEVDEYEGRPFLVMEYVPGGTLRTLLAQRQLSPTEAAELVETLARAMHHAHDRGVIHRDLKPANVLIANAERGMRNAESKAEIQLRSTAVHSALRIPHSALKIADFGLAAHFSPDATYTATGQLIGTASCMAPEQAEAGPGG
ncbi:MAG TPA: protein kinase [Gemmataceae bacterium]|nr:protein kinase [Gemmataceae bacterium]